MCNPTQSSPSKVVFYKNTLFKNLNNNPPKSMDDNHHQLHGWPTPSQALEEIKAIGKISGPTAITGLLLYSRAMISMLFLGNLGELELAGGSLSIGFANITGYSIISGLAMGMEPICGQAYGAKQMKLLGLTLQRTILLLLSTSLPISFIWLNMKTILIWCGQDKEISTVAQTFIVFSIPDLFVLSLLHPLRIYLRTQNITLPLTCCSAVSILIHVPLNILLVGYFKLGVIGVAVAVVITNLNLLFLLVTVVYFYGMHQESWVPPSTDCLNGWSSLLALAIPTCVSVCLEWWWYELMIILCGLLSNPRATVASMAMVFTTLMRHRWGRFFTADVEILELTSVALPLAGLCELGNCPQTTGCGVLRGSARPTVGANINLGSFYFVGMPVAILMGFAVKLGFAGLWFGLFAAQVTCALLMLYVLFTTDWNVQVERANELAKPSSSTFSCLPANSPLPETITNDVQNSMEPILEEIVLISSGKEVELVQADCSSLETYPLIVH
ncbi:putative multi antimicrobial extrusion protein [Helianthus annuus]|nr:putative multi antimicrobial extrusion protein [Helianthus annuus]